MICSILLLAFSLWQEQIQRGKDLMRAQQYAEARAHFAKAAKLNPDSEEAFFYLGLSALRMGARGEAQQAWRRSLQIQPGAVPSLYNLGVLLLEDKHASEAINMFERVRKAGIMTPELAANLMRAYLVAGRRESALKFLAMADEQFSKVPAFHTAAGVMLNEHGLAESACKEFGEANQLLQGESGVSLSMASTCLTAGDLVAARVALMGIPESAQASAQYHALLAQLHLASNEKEAADREVDKAIRIEPSNSDLLLRLARVYQKDGEQQKALILLRKAAVADPFLAEVPYSIAVTLITAEDEPGAIKLLEKAIKLNPRFDRAQFFLGTIHLSALRLDEADPLLTAALEAQPLNPFYLCFLGLLRINQSRFEEAKQLLAKAEAISPSYALPHYYMGRALQQSGALKPAVVELQKTISLNPNLPEAYYQLGTLLGRLGQKEEAEAALVHFKSFRGQQDDERSNVLRELRETLR